MSLFLNEKEKYPRTLAGMQVALGIAAGLFVKSQIDYLNKIEEARVEARLADTFRIAPVTSVREAVANLKAGRPIGEGLFPKTVASADDEPEISTPTESAPAIIKKASSF